MADLPEFDFPEGSKIEVSEKPVHEKLHHSQKMHGTLLSELNSMINASESHIEQRFDDWDRVDAHMRLYMDPEAMHREADKTLSPDNKAMPYKGTIAMPVTYSMLMTRAAHKFALLTAVDPRIHYEGVDSDDYHGSQIHEVLARYDLRQSRFDVKIWQAIMDTERYGLAIWYDTFEEQFGYQRPRGMSPLEMLLAGVDPEEGTWERIKEWNNIAAIDPRMLRPDPNVPISDVQSMNYIGHEDHTNLMWYLERKLSEDNGPFFNMKHFRRISQGVAGERNVDGRWMDGEYNNEHMPKYNNPKVVHLQWKIIPSEFGLSKNERPEIWWFSVYNGELIIRAHKSVYAHNQFTYCINQADSDLHAPFTPGAGQQMIGGQDLTNWLTGSMIANTKKIVNDQVIFNDDLIDPVDMATPGPAKHIRLTRRGKRLQEMGQMRIQDMYGQLNVTDITGQHLETSQAIYMQLQRMASVPDTMQGMPLPTKRTLGEVEKVNQSATLRLGVDAQMLDLSLVKPFAERLITNRQQFTSIQRYYRLAGRLIEQLGAEQFEVGPDDLQGEYDYIAHTPTMAPDPARQSALWGQLLQMLAQAPQLMNPDANGMVLNPIAVFDHFVRSTGVNYLDQFKTPMTPQPGPGQLAPENQTGASQPGVDVQTEDQIAKGVQSGNLVPM
ncbi:MAG: hypothetical protein KAJ06_09290 [Gammaproteobacteria bacterium]|nr:hypothetical protein [Gammaproteobacteria bacterium]